MTHWQPTFKWHVITLGVLLVLSGIVYGAFYWASLQLPAPYQPRTVAQGTTPWNH